MLVKTWTLDTPITGIQKTHIIHIHINTYHTYTKRHTEAYKHKHIPHPLTHTHTNYTHINIYHTYTQTHYTHTQKKTVTYRKKMFK